MVECMPLPYCVYILFSEKDQQLYTGFTSNILQRIQQHNNGLNTSTANRRPLHLIFCEFYCFETDARNRETYLKTTMGKRAVKFMLASTLDRLGHRRKQ